MSKTFAKVASYPLDWPSCFPASKRHEQSRFKTTLTVALKNVNDELQRFANDSGKRIESIVISSNYSLTEQKPANPGVATWFVWDGEQHCIPVDRYAKVEDNLQAVFRCLEAKRTLLRHGGIELTKASMRGVLQLENKPSKTWHELFETTDPKQAEAAYKRLRSKHHPDKGGNPLNFAAIQLAYEESQEDAK